jgi:hypothetical protein
MPANQAENQIQPACDGAQTYLAGNIDLADDESEERHHFWHRATYISLAWGSFRPAITVRSA